MKKLIIFDCDGVLVDSEIIANHVFAQWLTGAGYPISTEESIKRFVGMGRKDVQELLAKEAGLIISTEDFSDIRDNAFRAVNTGERVLAPLMHDFLEILTHKKIDRCIASNNYKDNVIRSLAITQQLNFFDQEHIFSAQQVVQAKPAPDLFLFAAKTMGYAPQDCIVIEDSTAGIQAAQAAGMQVIGFVGASHSHFDWYQDKLRAYNIPLAHSPHDIITMLDALQSPMTTKNYDGLESQHIS